MVAEIKSDQRIARLTPLAEVLAYIDSHVKPATSSRRDVASARCLTLAESIVVTQQLPAHPIALRDGFAVESESIRDASSYAPAIIPMPVFVGTGDALPSGTDAILPQDAVTIRGTTAEILSSVTPGDGVLPKGADADTAIPLLDHGTLLRDRDVAVLQAAGVATVNIRAPSIAILHAGRGDNRILNAALEWITRAIAVAGGLPDPHAHVDLESALQAEKSDAAIVIGGTGTGPNDAAIATLARVGKVAFHGIAIAPGETAAVGFVGDKPVLLVPGRLDAAIACWLFLGERILACLSGRLSDETGRTVRLTRKVSSSLGITELIPVSCNAGDAEPLGAGYLSLQTLARADAWISVPAQSEGYPAGTAVTARPLP